MGISAQMRLGGFYAWVTPRIASLPLGPAALLAAVIAVVAALSVRLARIAPKNVTRVRSTRG